MDNIQQPLVSIVFTSYNHKEYLREALDSLVNQTYTNLEIIIIDDCSTDGSQEILKEYQNKLNIHLKLQKKNSGSYVRASNLGASFAIGEYILFAQCDDFAESNQIETLMETMLKNPSVGVVFSRSNLINEQSVVFSDDFKGRESKFKKSILNNGLITNKQMKEYLSFSCVIPNLSAALINHSIFKEINGLSDKFSVVADWEFWLNLTEKTNFYYLKQPLNNFRQHSTTIRSKVKMQTQVQEIYSMFYNHIDANQLKKSEIRKIKIGAGAVWFTYFIENKKLWLTSFKSIYFEIKKIERLPFFYLLLGAKKHVVEFAHRKLN